MTMTYQQVATLLSLLDAAGEQDMDVSCDGFHLSVTAWRRAPRPATSPRIDDFAGAVHPGPATVPVISGLPGFWEPAGTGVGRPVEQGTVLGSLVSAGGRESAVTTPVAGQLRELLPEKGAFVECGETVALIRADSEEGGKP